MKMSDEKHSVALDLNRGKAAPFRAASSAIANRFLASRHRPRPSGAAAVPALLDKEV